MSADRAPSDRQRLLDLFDAVANLNVPVVVYEHEQPEAPDALRAWAESVGCEVHTIDVGTAGRMTWVDTRYGRRGILVYSRRAA